MLYISCFAPSAPSPTLIHSPLLFCSCALNSRTMLFMVGGCPLIPYLYLFILCLGKKTNVTSNLLCIKRGLVKNNESCFQKSFHFIKNAFLKVNTNFFKSTGDNTFESIYFAIHSVCVYLKIKACNSTALDSNDICCQKQTDQISTPAPTAE